MDANGFRKSQEPSFFTEPSNYKIQENVNRNSVFTTPTPDNRYPGFAANMTDGRLTTDYRPKCSQNVAPGMQFATRRWLQKNADHIIGVSRNRQADLTGAGMGYDYKIEMAPLAYVKCDESDCGYTAAKSTGLGIERQDKAVPLFGTFAPSAAVTKKDSPKLTRVYEGGRNSIRGRI